VVGATRRFPAKNHPNHSKSAWVDGLPTGRGGSLLVALAGVDQLCYSARRIDNSTVHLVLRGSTFGSVQKAS